jgi:hypothetical protein
VVGDHYGRLFRSNKGKSGSGPGGGMYHGMQCSVRGNSGFFGKVVRPPTSIGVGGLHGGGCLARRSLTLEASMEEMWYGTRRCSRWWRVTSSPRCIESVSMRGSGEPLWSWCGLICCEEASVNYVCIVLPLGVVSNSLLS